MANMSTRILRPVNPSLMHVPRTSTGSRQSICLQASISGNSKSANAASVVSTSGGVNPSLELGVGAVVSEVLERLFPLSSADPDDFDTSFDGFESAVAEDLVGLLSSSPVLATVANGAGGTLFVQDNGNLTFVENGCIVSEGVVSLPDECVGVSPTVEKKLVAGSSSEEVLVRWGAAASPLALLHVIPHADVADGTSSSTWTKNMKRGFVVEYEIAGGLAKEASGAEISIRLERSGHWFGGGHFIRQIWPLNDASLEVGPWYAFDNGPNGVNNLLGGHWMTSQGLLVSVDPAQQYLHIGMNAPNQVSGAKDKKMKNLFKRKWGVGIQNATRELLPLTKGHGKIARAGQDGLLRIQARSNYVDASMEHPLKHWQHEYNVNDDGMLSVRVSMSMADNAAEACRMALGSMTPPKQMPDASMFRYPIWTTWARYKARVSQEKVLTYAKEITDRCLPRSVMEIDDRWQVSYGDLRFDPKKFPDPVGMIRELHAMGFKVTTWVHPFVQRESEAYREGAERGYFVGCDMADHPENSGFWSAFFKWDWLFGTSTSSSEALKYGSISTAPGGPRWDFSGGGTPRPSRRLT